MGKSKQKEKNQANYEHKDLNTIYNHPKQFNGLMKKYWNQRHKLFKRYDEGILLTKELWFSVTPEILSKFMAKFIMKHFTKDNDHQICVLDAFCGGGGNIVQFINYGCKVYCVDINLIHLQCTSNNIKVYFDQEIVENDYELIGINWKYADPDIEDDFIDEEWEENLAVTDDADTTNRIYANKEETIKEFEKIRKVNFDVVFGSPPWGGPEYMKSDCFDLENGIKPYGLTKMLSIFSSYSENICLFLPKNTNIKDIERITKKLFGRKYINEGKLRVLKVGIDQYIKGYLICWGEKFKQKNNA